jgi:rRNA small subunit pseudouridine methyltransferase Nep1
LIEVSPHIRIPRTYRRFAGLMVQLLHKLKIRASDGPEVLLKVVKNPVTLHLPQGCLKLGTSVKGAMTDVNELIPTLPQNEPVVFVVGAHAHGPAEVDYTERSIAISRYPLSAAGALARITTAFENHWSIL